MDFIQSNYATDYFNYIGAYNWPRVKCVHLKSFLAKVTKIDKD